MSTIVNRDVSNTRKYLEKFKNSSLSTVCLSRGNAPSVQRLSEVVQFQESRVHKRKPAE